MRDREKERGVELSNIEWTRVVPRFYRVMVLRVVIGWLVWSVLMGVFGFGANAMLQSIEGARIPDFAWVVWLVLGFVLACAIIGMIVGLGRARSRGFALRQDDVLARRGFVSIIVNAVPYGRMQLVDVRRGPLERMFGLATVNVTTAAPGAGANIPGLPLEEADRLRNHLISVAETRRAGI